MNIKRAKEEIKDSIEAYLLKDEDGEYVIPNIRQRPLLLMGAPGIGKTQIMEQIAKECRIGLVAYTITHHTRQSAIGLPFISQKEYGGMAYSVTEYTMSEIVASIYEKIEHTGLTEGILFIDEINCVSETLAPAMLQFLQCKTFGNHAIPRGWMIVAAGNPPEYNKSVREFDVVTMDRVKKINVEPDYQVWKEYAYKEKIHGAVISYLNTKPRYFYQMETTVDGKMFATPRGWEDLSRLISVYEVLKKKMDREVVIQYIQHPKIAKDFANYLELYYKYQADYQVERVLQGEIDSLLLKKLAHASFDERVSVIGLLLERLSTSFRREQEMEGYVERLYQQLKSIKKCLEKSLTGEEEKSPVHILEQGLWYTEQELEKKKKAEILGREEKKTLTSTIKTLEDYRRKLEAEDIYEAGPAVERLQELFLEETEKLEACQKKSEETLEYVFDFMEAAFGESQEMAVFMTELNANIYSVKFLQEYDCERYFRYNKQLLFEENNQELLKRIDCL